MIVDKMKDSGSVRMDAKILINRFLMAFVIFLVTAAAFEGYFAKWAFHDNDFDAFLDGSLIRPWVYRRLVPEAANAFRAALSDEQEAALIETLENDNFLGATFRKTDIRHRYIIEYYFMYFVSFAAFFASAFLWKKIATEVTSDPIAGTLGALLFILLIPLLETSGGYFYDFTELLFFAAAILLAIRKNWIGILLLTPFAEINKESFFFLLFALYPFFRSKFTLREIVPRLGISILIAGLIYVYIHELYADNDGWTTVFFLPTNIEYLAPLVAILIMYLISRRTIILIASLLLMNVFPERYCIIEHTYSVFSGEKLFLPHLLMLGWLIHSTWDRLSGEWKQHAIIAAAINLPLWILFCYPGELRNLSMLYPTLVLMLSFYIDGVIRQ